MDQPRLYHIEGETIDYRNTSSGYRLYYKIILDTEVLTEFENDLYSLMQAAADETDTELDVSSVIMHKEYKSIIELLIIGEESVVIAILAELAELEREHSHFFSEGTNE